MLIQPSLRCGYRQMYDLNSKLSGIAVSFFFVDRTKAKRREQPKKQNEYHPFLVFQFRFFFVFLFIYFFDFSVVFFFVFRIGKEWCGIKRYIYIYSQCVHNFLKIKTDKTWLQFGRVANKFRFSFPVSFSGTTIAATANRSLLYIFIFVAAKHSKRCLSIYQYWYANLLLSAIPPPSFFSLLSLLL